jgi:hypothetical protein
VELFTGLPEAIACAAGGLLLAGMAAVTVPLLSYARRWAFLALPAMALPFLLIPTVGQVQNYPDLHNQPMEDLAGWARNFTEADDVFLFPDVHRGLAPGIFRAKSYRALYVDWKTGGQVNIVPELGREWGQRWKAVNEAKLPLLPLERYRALGIDYLVVNPANVPAGVNPSTRTSSMR